LPKVASTDFGIFGDFPQGAFPKVFAVRFVLL